MFTTLLISCVVAACTCSNAKVITLTIGGSTLTNQVTIGTNEVAEVKTYFDSSSLDGNAVIEVRKDSRSFSIPGNRFMIGSTPARWDKVTIAGPATVAFLYPSLPSSEATAFATIEITPESFPPGLTVILPDGTVGIVHVESSTNLIQWQDEWVHTFSNTNQNRFFRIRAERSLP